jgi:hypothetical protein
MRCRHKEREGPAPAVLEARFAVTKPRTTQGRALDVDWKICQDAPRTLGLDWIDNDPWHMSNRPTERQVARFIADEQGFLRIWVP